MILAPPLFNYFTLFGFRIHFYSLCIFCGVVVSFFTMLYLCKKYNPKLNRELLIDIAPFLIVFSVIGARLYYVLLSLDYFINNPVAIFMVWHGGIAIHGAIIGGILYALYFLKKRKTEIFPYFDAVSLVLPLGQAIGRWGNFFNSEAFGKPVSDDFLIKLSVHFKYRPQGYTDFDYFHPTFLYESVLDLLIFGIIFLIYKKTASRACGLTFFSYLILYSLIRIPLEFLRIDTAYYLYNIPFPVLVSVVGIFIGIVGIYKRLKQS